QRTRRHRGPHRRSRPSGNQASRRRDRERFRPSDGAFNNAAGSGQAPTPLVDLPVDAYDSAIAITLRSVFLSMKYEIPAMLKAGGGAIVNMSSAASLHALPRLPA